MTLASIDGTLVDYFSLKLFNLKIESRLVIKKSQIILDFEKSEPKIQ